MRNILFGLVFIIGILGCSKDDSCELEYSRIYSEYTSMINTKYSKGETSAAKRLQYEMESKLSKLNCN